MRLFLDIQSQRAFRILNPIILIYKFPSSFHISTHFTLVDVSIKPTAFESISNNVQYLCTKFDNANSLMMCLWHGCCKKKVKSSQFEFLFSSMNKYERHRACSFVSIWIISKITTVSIWYFECTCIQNASKWSHNGSRKVCPTNDMKAQQTHTCSDHFANIYFALRIYLVDKTIRKVWHIIYIIHLVLRSSIICAHANRHTKTCTYYAKHKSVQSSKE